MDNHIFVFERAENKVRISKCCCFGCILKQLITFPPNESDTVPVFLQPLLSHLQPFDGLTPLKIYSCSNKITPFWNRSCWRNVQQIVLTPGVKERDKHLICEELTGSNMCLEDAAMLTAREESKALFFKPRSQARDRHNICVLKQRRCF